MDREHIRTQLHYLAKSCCCCFFLDLSRDLFQFENSGWKIKSHNSVCLSAPQPQLHHQLSEGMSWGSPARALLPRSCWVHNRRPSHVGPPFQKKKCFPLRHLLMLPVFSVPQNPNRNNVHFVKCIILFHDFCLQKKFKSNSGHFCSRNVKAHFGGPCVRP